MTLLLLVLVGTSTPAVAGERLWPEEPAKKEEANRWLTDRAGFHLGPGLGLGMHEYGAFGATARITGTYQLGRVEFRLTASLGPFDRIEAGAEFSAVVLQLGAEASVRVHLLDLLALGVGTVQSVDGVISTNCTVDVGCDGRRRLHGSFALAIWPLVLHFGRQGQHQLGLTVTLTVIRPDWPPTGASPAGVHISYDLMF